MPPIDKDQALGNRYYGEPDADDDLSRQRPDLSGSRGDELRHSEAIPGPASRRQVSEAISEAMTRFAEVICERYKLNSPIVMMQSSPLNFRRAVIWIGRLVLGPIFIYAGYSKLFCPIVTCGRVLRRSFRFRRTLRILRFRWTLSSCCRRGECSSSRTLCRLPKSFWGCWC